MCFNRVEDDVIESDDSSSSSSDSDESDDVSGNDSDLGDLFDDEIGELVIDERPKEIRDIVTVVDDANNNVGGRGRSHTRNQRRAISASVDSVGVTLTPSQGPPSKKSRSSSRTRSRSHSPALDLPPPPPQRTQELEQAALEDYMKKVASMSKAYIQETSPHRGFGRRPDSLRPLNVVSRGGMSMSALRRWTRDWGGPFASDGGYAAGYYDADETYYTDPEALNPRKPQKSKKGGVAAVQVATGIGQPGPSTQVVTSPSRESPMEVDAPATTLALPSAVAPILKPPRSFEQRPQVRLPRGCKQRVIKVNIAGVVCNVMNDIDDDTGRMEDRRSQWTIDRNIDIAIEKDSYASMSEDEYEEAMVKKEEKKEKKAQRKHVKLQPQRLRAVHANKKDSVVFGDEYIGQQASKITKSSKQMAEVLVRQTLKWTTPRLDGQSRPSLRWIDCVDRVGDIDDGFVGKFSSKETLDPIDDVTLIRAKVSNFDFLLVT